MVQREFAPLAAAKKEMVEKPRPSPGTAQTFGKLDPQAMRGAPLNVASGGLPPDVRISQQDVHTATADHLQLPTRGPDAAGVLDQVNDLAGKGAHALDRIFDFGVKATDVVGRNGFEFLRDKTGEGLRAVTSDDPVGDLIDMLPLKNAAKAAIQELPPFSRDKITLDDDAIKLIKQDPAFIAHEGEVVAAIKKDPRYGRESFPVSLSELPVDPYVEFGGKRGAGDQSGNIKITYQVIDKIDLRPNGSSGAYDKVTGIMGTIWHDKLHAKESQISGSFSTETKAG